MTYTARFSAAMRAVFFWLTVTALVTASAQDFTGTYQTNVEQGTFTVELTMQGERFMGVMQGPGVRFQLEGWVEDGVGVGVATSADGVLGFEAMVDGDLLGLWFYEVVNGTVVAESEIEVILERVGTATAAAPQQPTAQQQPAAPPAPSPALPPQPRPPATAGTPRKQLPGAPPAAQPVPPTALPAATTAPAAPASQQDSPIIATGSFGSLTQDDALAFIEALEFVLEQVGYAYRFTEAERGQAFQLLAQNYPQLSQSEQVVLSQARDIWERVRANWATTSLDEQREFAVGVLALAFGEETVAQWAGSGGGGQGENCTTFEDCTSSLMGGEGWSDTFNAQSCWAAAGCDSYDPSTNTFDYESY